MKFKRFALMVVLAALAATFVACGQTGGKSEALSALPDGEYQWIMSMNPNELLKSQFVTSLKEGFPMAEGALSEMTAKANETGMKLDDVKVVSVFGNTGGDVFLFADSTLSADEAIKVMKEEKGESFKETEKDSVKYFMNEDTDEAVFFSGNTIVQSSQKAIEKMLETKAGKGKKYLDSEAYKKAAKYYDPGQTISFYAGDIASQGGVNPSMAAMAFAEFETDQAKLQALGEAMAKATSFGGKIKVTDAIKGDLAVIYSDAEAAKLIADFFTANKDKMFEKAAVQAEQAAAMTGLNYDKDKVLALKNAFNFKADGEALVININLSWNDISFLFAE